MRIIYTVSKDEAEEISRVQKNIKNKQTDKQLYAVELQGREKNNKEIAEKLDTSAKVVSHWVSAHKNSEIEALLSKRKGSNRWNISFEEEKLLSKFKEKSNKGQIVEVSEI